MYVCVHVFTTYVYLGLTLQFELAIYMYMYIPFCRQREKSKQTDGTPLALFNLFVERVREQLHVVLAMSPIGDAFRNRVRMFPSLVNCCTINWFQVLHIVHSISTNYFYMWRRNIPTCTCTCRCENTYVYWGRKLTSQIFSTLQSWPDDALTIVAQRFLDDVEMEDRIKDGCVEMCKEFHQTTRKLSDRYLATLQRHNYVTPTSYLELISTYKTLLSMKRRSAYYVYMCTYHSEYNSHICMYIASS